jgi:hypothetical protein
VPHGIAFVSNYSDKRCQLSSIFNHSINITASAIYMLLILQKLINTLPLLLLLFLLLLLLTALTTNVLKTAIVTS